MRSWRSTTAPRTTCCPSSGRRRKPTPKVKVVDLAKNGGRHCALMAGFHVASGDYVVCIDDDLQCPTDQLWNLLAPLEAGDYDVSIARYAKKKQSAFKNFGSSVHNKVSDWLLGKDKNLRFSNFSAMRRFVRVRSSAIATPIPTSPACAPRYQPGVQRGYGRAGAHHWHRPLHL